MNNPERTVPEMVLEVLLRGKAFTKVYIEPPPLRSQPPRAPYIFDAIHDYVTLIYTVKWGRAILHYRPPLTQNQKTGGVLGLYLPGDPSSSNRYDKTCRVFLLDDHCGPIIRQALAFAVRAASTAPEAGVHTYIRGRYIS